MAWSVDPTMENKNRLRRYQTCRRQLEACTEQQTGPQRKGSPDENYQRCKKTKQVQTKPGRPGSPDEMVPEVQEAIQVHSNKPNHEDQEAG